MESKRPIQDEDTGYRSCVVLLLCIPRHSTEQSPQYLTGLHQLIITQSHADIHKLGLFLCLVIDSLVCTMTKTHIHIVIRFVSISAKFDICIVVGLMGQLLKVKLRICDT
jgi:hypothetical protein